MPVNDLNFIKKYRFELIGIILCLGLGWLSGYIAQAGNSIWYDDLSKPSFNPPNWIFGPVWTVLYIMMGIVLGKLWRHRLENKLILLIFFVQLAFNLLWSILFFYFQRIDLALYDLCLLWLSLMLFMVLARKKCLVFLLFLPYTIWVSFALLLNFSIYYLNS